MAPDRRSTKQPQIRRITPDDAPALERFYAGLSSQSRRLRFFAIGACLTHDQSSQFCAPDHHHREGFVAVDPGVAGQEPAVVGHLCLEPDGAGRAEVAIAVADAYQRRGIGRRLMEAGMAWARHEGIGHLTAIMLAENQGILRLLDGLGCRTRIDPAPGDLSSLVIELDLPGIAAA